MIANAARRVAVTLSSGGLWQVAGFDRGDGDDSEPPFKVPAFQGIGFASRPSGDTEAEAILVRLGEEHFAIVGLRDEDIRINLEAGETAIFNKAGASVKLTKDGHIDLSPAAGRQIRNGGDTATNGVIKGTERNTSEQVFLTALDAFAQATAAAPLAKSTFTAALNAFKTAAAAAISQTTLTE